MGSVVVVRTVTPFAFTNPASFARGVVAGNLNAARRTQLALTEAILEEEGLAKLAKLLQAVREGRYVSPAEIEAQAAPHLTKVAKALARGIPWRVRNVKHSGAMPAMFASPRSRPPIEQRVGVEAGRGFQAAVPNKRAERVAASHGNPVGGPGVVGEEEDDEENLAGKGWRQEILPEVLADFLGYNAPPLLSAWDVFIARGQSASVPIKVVALRVLGDEIGRLQDRRDIAQSAKILMDVLEDPGADSRIKESALFVVQGHRGELFSSDENNNLFRIRTSSSSVSLPWSSVIPEILGIEGEGEALAIQARGIFEQTAPGFSDWKKGLAMVLYSFLLIRRLYLSRQEAEAATISLLGIISYYGEGHYLGRTAVATYTNIVHNQISNVDRREIADLRWETREWVMKKVKQLKSLLSDEHEAVRELKIRRIGAWGSDWTSEPKETHSKPQNRGEPPPPWWRRAWRVIVRVITRSLQ